MPSCESRLLFELASRFRDGIVARKSELGRYSPKFEGFPKNCCGVAANLLAKYLSSNGCGEWDIVSGIRQDGEMHHWLEQGDVIVDITADQFPDGKEQIMVTTDHSWHREFNIDVDRHVADFTLYPSPQNYQAMYEIVCPSAAR